jgi:hypothetical protein
MDRAHYQMATWVDKQGLGLGGKWGVHCDLGVCPAPVITPQM